MRELTTDEIDCVAGGTAEFPGRIPTNLLAGQSERSYFLRVTSHARQVGAAIRAELRETDLFS